MSRKTLSTIFAIIYYSFLLLALIIFGSSLAFAQSATVTLAWDANVEPDLKDYTIYKSEISNDYDKAVTYKVSLNPAGRNIACPEPYDPFKSECCEFTVSDLELGKTYYFVATASDEEQNESAYSEQLVHTPTVPNQKSTQIKKIMDIQKIEK
jgi:hypothetical protein